MKGTCLNSLAKASMIIMGLLVGVTWSVVSAVSVTAQTSPGPIIARIVTSADSAGGIFFGQAAVQIVVVDPNAKSGGGVVQSTVPVSVIAESSGKQVAANTFDIPETVLGSGKFEFYLTHHNSIFSNGFGIHPLNTFGIGRLTNKSEALQLSNPSIGKVAPVVTFGLHGDLDTGSKLFENVVFKIQYGAQQILLLYQHTPSQLVLDRDTYGSGSIIHVFIADQDANLNPTVPVQFSVTKDQLKNLFSLAGGIFNVKNNITFTETAPNTGLFEGQFRLNDTIIPTAKSLILTLHDKVDYDHMNSPANNNHTDTSTASFIVRDTDASFSIPNIVTFSKGVRVVVTDPDQNKDSEVADTLQGHLKIAIEGVGGDSETTNLIESEANSGLFFIDNPGNALKMSFTSAPTSNNNGILEFTSRNIHNSVKVTYFDPQNHAGKQESFTTTFKLHTTPGNITLPSSVGMNDQFVLSINHPDLNYDPNSNISYTFIPVNNRTVPLVRGNEALGEFAEIQIQVIRLSNNITASSFSSYSGNNGTHTGGIGTFTLVETAPNTGVFESKIGIKDLANALGYPIKVGDKIRIVYFDKMESPTYVSSAVMKVTQ